MRIWQTKRPHRSPEFRLQFFGVGANRRPIIVADIGIQAASAAAAIRKATVAIWPPNAIGLRILDSEGQEVYERRKADRR
jgi:hypothetical protein